MIQYKIVGYNRVRNSLRRLASLNSEVIDPVVGGWAKSTARKLKSTKYPPKRPNQRYKRTGQLANKWSAVRIIGGQWTIENRAQQKGRIYARYVVGDEQAWMHKGRWWRASDEIAKYTPDLTKQLTSKIEDIWQTS